MQKKCSPDSITLTDDISPSSPPSAGRWPSVPASPARSFQALGENGINIRMITQGADELNIIFGVDNKDFEKAIRRSVQQLCKLTYRRNAYMKNYNVAVLGATGAVGQEMIKVLEERNFPVAELRSAGQRPKRRAKP